MEDNRNDELHTEDTQQNTTSNDTSYEPNFQATFSEPVRPERRSTAENSYNSTNTYSHYQNAGANGQQGYYNAAPNGQTGSYNGAYGNPYYTSGNGFNYGGDQQPPLKPKKKRIVLKVAIGVVAAVFLGFGSYGAYEHFFVDSRNVSVEGNKDTNKNNNDAITDNNDSKDDQGALIEDNKNSSTVIKQTTTSEPSGDNQVVTVSENTQPSIVAINCTVETQNVWGQSYNATGSGSGIIIKQTDSTLLIATNNHVVENTTNLDVVFTDGESVPASVKGTDSTSDLAVVEVKLSDIKESTLNSIKIATLGSSDELKVGEMVVAIGNALGYGQSVTVGYVSAKDREVTIDGKKMVLLQTDAAINPGNSGGALLNLKGEVIGINSAKFASESVEGMGYSIPITSAIPIINQLVDREVLSDDEKGYIGISGQTVSDEMHTSMNYPYGVLVSEVAKDGAAEKGGIRAYDIITKLNGSEITTMEGFKERLNSYRAGTEVEITVQRIIDGAYTEQTLKVTLADQKVLNGLQSGSNDNGSGQSNSNGNGNNTNPNGDNTNPNGDDSDPYSDYYDQWPWNLFQ